MAKKQKQESHRGSRLNAALAETVFGWKDVHFQRGGLIGKKPDKLGRLRPAKVPDYAGDPSQGYAIDERMKLLGKAAEYLKQLAVMTRANKLPLDWATSEQRSRAAIAAMTRKHKKKK
jgi:hypothetical protein